MQNIETHIGNVSISINTDHLSDNLKEAHKRLNTLIVNDCEPYIPFSQGILRSSVNYPSGIDGDEISWNTPYAHYQYMGELYLTANGSSWARKGETKYPSGRDLIYHGGGGMMWFENAKEIHEQEWINEVKKVAGGR